MCTYYEGYDFRICNVLFCVKLVMFLLLCFRTVYVNVFEFATIPAGVKTLANLWLVVLKFVLQLLFLDMKCIHSKCPSNTFAIERRESLALG